MASLPSSATLQQPAAAPQARPLTAAEQAADRRLFEELAHRHYRQAYHIAYRLTSSHADAEDLAQEAMIRAFTSFHRYRRDLPFANWLYRILVNLHIDELRRKPKAYIDSIDNMPGLAELPDFDSDPADLILSQEIDTSLQRALASLAKEFRTAVVLCDIEGLSYEEIAQVMGCSIGTVRSRIHRGRNQLRRFLGVVT